MSIFLEILDDGLLPVARHLLPGLTHAFVLDSDDVFGDVEDGLFDADVWIHIQRDDFDSVAEGFCWQNVWADFGNGTVRVVHNDALCFFEHGT